MKKRASAVVTRFGKRRRPEVKRECTVATQTAPSDITAASAKMFELQHLKLNLEDPLKTELCGICGDKCRPDIAHSIKCKCGKSTCTSCIVHGILSTKNNPIAAYNKCVRGKFCPCGSSTSPVQILNACLAECVCPDCNVVRCGEAARRAASLIGLADKCFSFGPEFVAARRAVCGGFGTCDTCWSSAKIVESMKSGFCEPTPCGKFVCALNGTVDKACGKPCYTFVMAIEGRLGQGALQLSKKRFFARPSPRAFVGRQYFGNVKDVEGLVRQYLQRQLVVECNGCGSSLVYASECCHLTCDKCGCEHCALCNKQIASNLATVVSTYRDELAGVVVKEFQSSPTMNAAFHYTCGINADGENALIGQSVPGVPAVGCPQFPFQMAKTFPFLSRLLPPKFEDLFTSSGAGAEAADESEEHDEQASVARSATTIRVCHQVMRACGPRVLDALFDTKSNFMHMLWTAGGTLPSFPMMSLDRFVFGEFMTGAAVPAVSKNDAVSAWTVLRGPQEGAWFAFNPRNAYGKKLLDANDIGWAACDDAVALRTLKKLACEHGDNVFYSNTVDPFSDFDDEDLEAVGIDALVAAGTEIAT